MRERGIVKWWNNEQGWGFITRPGERDLLVRHDRVSGGGFKELAGGDLVEFEIRSGARGPYAAKVVRVADLDSFPHEGNARRSSA